MTIQIKQQTVPKGKDWWEWSVWLEGDKKQLDAIDHVVYTLHPTFPNPVVRVSNRKTGFRLDSSGWGNSRSTSRSTRRMVPPPSEYYLELRDSEEHPSRTGKKSGKSASPNEPPRHTVFVSGVLETGMPFARSAMRSWNRIFK